MYERLDKLRADLEKARQRKVEAEVRVKAAEEKLREAENSQVLNDVNALKLSPEQVAQFLKLATSGQLPLNGMALNLKDEKEELAEVDEEKREDFEDEEDQY